MSDDIDSEKTETARRAAIARILRRRHRRAKPRANSGATETSWAEYGTVTLTPSSSDQSFFQYLGYGILLVVAFVFPVLVVAVPSSDFLIDTMYDLSHIPIWGMVIMALLAIALAVAGFAALVVVATSFIRIVAQNLFRRR